MQLKPRLDSEEHVTLHVLAQQVFAAHTTRINHPHAHSDNDLVYRWKVVVRFFGCDLDEEYIDQT